MKKVNKLGIAALAVVAAIGFAGCGSEGGSKSGGFDMTKDIHVISREDGSGTRGAFIELLGIEVKKDGKKVDRTSAKAQITNSTNVMMTSVANDEYAIGYISLGSLNDTVKALDVDGASATTENIMSDKYKLARPFYLVQKDGSPNAALAADFMKFIFSKEGQKIISDNGYVQAVKDAKDYAPTNVKGKLVVAGSSSVTPVMEKLAEAYTKINPDMKVEVQQSDSTTGVQSAINGTADIGMASRDLKDSEKGKVKGVVIAKDGLAIVVNKKNPLNSIKSEQIRDIYIDSLKKWQDIK